MVCNIMGTPRDLFSDIVASIVHVQIENVKYAQLACEHCKVACRQAVYIKTKQNAHVKTVLVNNIPF